MEDHYMAGIRRNALSLRYYSFSQHLREYFDDQVVKICVDAGFTCPNRDGTRGFGGCVYCNDIGSGAPYIDRESDVIDQIKSRYKKISRKGRTPAILVYFQAFSNTYAPVDRLKKLYSSALDIEKVKGISIGTRPDCVSEEVLDLISHLSEETYLWLEYGLESIHNKTLESMNRGHTYQDFLKAYTEAKKRKIKICLHIIVGLPGESRDDILKTAKECAKLEPDGIKIHSLYIEKGTVLHNRYLKDPWKIFTLEEYIEIAAEFLEYLPAKTVIHRLLGEAIPERLVEPGWSADKNRVLQGINKRLEDLNSRQGAKFEQITKSKE
ncbi:MAG: TIGR01212 family radical SAM protein [bacterium]|nr:TIGR01212 family radical SAM protein [bacterium]